MSKLPIGLALGGGGARGIAHIGVIEILHNQGLHIAEIAGTSAGAIVGAMYAASRDPLWMEAHFRTFLKSSAFENLGTHRLARRYEDPESLSLFARRLQDHMVVNLSLHRRSLMSRDALREAIAFLVPARRFEDLLLPLKVCACDMSGGKLLVHESGDLIDAICDSASIPGVVEPRPDGGRIIADGAMLAPVPVRQLQQPFVIASDVSQRGLTELNEVNIYRLMMRAERMTQVALADELARCADFRLAPDVQGLHWSQFSKIESLLQAGRDEASSQLQQLLAVIRSRTPWSARIRRRLYRWLETFDAGPIELPALPVAAPTVAHPADSSDRGATDVNPTALTRASDSP